MTFIARKQTRTRRRAATKALVAALALASCVGCVGRKQYAINEAILISERRQLEDEIYRMQFELRDALDENERLRRELNGDAPAKDAKKTDSSRSNGGVATLYPGSESLQVSRPTSRTNRSANAASASANAGNYRDSNVAPATGGEVETLPDYVPIPLSSAPTGSRSNAPTGSVATSQNRAPQNPSAASVSPNYAERMPGVRRNVANGRGTSEATLSTEATDSDAAATSRNRVASPVYVENAQNSTRNVAAANYRQTTSTTAQKNSSNGSNAGESWSPLSR